MKKLNGTIIKETEKAANIQFTANEFTTAARPVVYGGKVHNPRNRKHVNIWFPKSVIKITDGGIECQDWFIEKNGLLFSTEVN